jgi:chemotaxis protein MotB
MEKGAQQPIIIKKGKGHGHGHHGGSWKVALADFMTAMMAFFMLMWLLGSTSSEEQKAISGYFQDPGSEYKVGSGGASPGVIQMEQPQQESHAEETTQETSDRDNTQENTEPGSAPKVSDAKLKKELERVEKEQLEALQQELQTQINQDTVFQQIKDQILIDQTALGLRIQIVDKDQRPSFDVGSAHLKSYSEEVLNALAPLLDKVKNKISVTGHTDSTPYGAGATYTNWELSADRANSARRALVQGGFPDGKVATVQGMGSAAPLVVEKPDAPINRRIAIIVLKKAVADALSNGGSGLSSGDLINSPEGDSEPHIMTQKEVDAATDAK